MFISSYRKLQKHETYQYFVEDIHYSDLFTNRTVNQVEEIPPKAII